MLKDFASLPNDVQVILCDNNSTDETVKFTQKWDECGLSITLDYYDGLSLTSGIDIPVNLLVLKQKRNCYFSKANNIMTRFAKGEYILYINNDVRVEKDYTTWFNKLIIAAEDGSIVGPTGGLLDKDFNFIRETRKIESGNFYMSGWCLCAKKETWHKLSLKGSDNNVVYPWDEVDFNFYFSDTDLSFRAKQLGIQFKVISIPVRHFGKLTAARYSNINNLYNSARKVFINKYKK
jgi:GT2 family glycosyltransferase